ncbi:hypothetical protein LJ737_25275 [Hymenobacter sp. 15J16-1T3B]|uniref:hypothetical protein n=1 Tax=Hymenobacter sp. 15J16-1T3B TaxID=2886941 RepID=UPI001D12DB9C|nr:hypothetical protein [Hymenobacter sp. 15J16-1T3B]MCC3160574.1 hypothetical protein [Hymenobacter sp. 15J16-1T3B]
MKPIRLTQLLHLAQYLLQSLMMAGLVLWAQPNLRRIPGPGGQAPALGPYALLAFLLILMVGSSLYTLSRYLRPELRRPIRENRRVYRSRQLLHNSLLDLLALPPLLLYAASGDPMHLLYFALLSAGLAAISWPTQHRYQRWLLSAERRRLR